MRAVAIVAALALASCGTREQSAEPSAQTGEASVQPASTGTPAEPAAASPAAMTTAPAGTGLVVLDAGGIAVRMKGIRTAFPFGTDRTAVDSAVAAALGARPVLTRLGECGAGAMEFSAIGPVKLNYQKGKLVGWMSEAGRNVATSDGIAPGITLDDLRHEREVTLARSTLPGEFSYAVPDGTTISGFSEGAGAGGKIVSLYAGVNCFFR
ncbi:hypothetical protein ACFO0A_08390 [Novosphingobium tardum]|uniref:Aspartate-semialdehyde dehydrogenase n=1 Tax=Novosphingobium tardum TaxID=1538021 RepID=A0ABV8RNW9_9SPHN